MPLYHAMIRARLQSNFSHDRNALEPSGPRIRQNRASLVPLHDMQPCSMPLTKMRPSPGPCCNSVSQEWSTSSSPRLSLQYHPGSRAPLDPAMVPARYTPVGTMPSNRTTCAAGASSQRSRRERRVANVIECSKRKCTLVDSAPQTNATRILQAGGTEASDVGFLFFRLDVNLCVNMPAVRSLWPGTCCFSRLLVARTFLVASKIPRHIRVAEAYQGLSITVAAN